MRLRNIEAVMRKEFLHVIRDFRSLYLAFAIPLLLILLFGYALSLDVDDIEMVVLDQDKTQESRNLIRELDASSYFSTKAHLANTIEMTDVLDHGSVALAVVIPPGFASTIKADRQAQVQIIIDGSDPNFASIVKGYITGFIDRKNQQLLFEFLNREGRTKINAPVDGRIRVWFNEELVSRNFIVPGITAIIIMIVGAMLTSLIIAREYENGTMETIKSLPLSGAEFLIGKAIPYFFITLTDVLIAVLMGQVLFGVVMKASFWLMLLASSLYILVAVFLGLFISNAVKSQLVANQTAILITYLPSLMLSNFVFPIINMPDALQYVTNIVPAKYYINILSGIYLRNLTLTHFWQDFLVLFIMLAVLFALNIRLLKKEGL
ncbi:MAG: hypothetical protein C0403_08510 [Desulfobacterium sp.]|nr:hypothetical protein [Desulfobacterium sp.]